MTGNLVLISGYYGFDNLGDEAILEELISELKTIVAPEDIMVLSANPELTSKRYSVKSMQRKSFGEFWTVLTQARMFISGGGGLFQNTKTLGSILFYGLQILMAKAHNVPVVIYAQGIGPLRGALANNLCKQFFSQSTAIALRDDASMSIAKSWNLQATRTADPVWRLEPTTPPSAVLEQLKNAAGPNRQKSKFIGLSLRPSADLTDAHLAKLAEGLAAITDESEQLVLLPLQSDQDVSVLKSFQQCWAKHGRRALFLDTSSLEYPSQWAALFLQFEYVVAMRLHALIFALKAELPVVGIAYDPKVTQLLAEFEQSCLILAKESDPQSWIDELKSFRKGMASRSKAAKQHLQAAKTMACQNLDLIAKILGHAKSAGS